MVLQVSWCGPTGSQRAGALSDLKILFGFGCVPLRPAGLYTSLLSTLSRGIHRGFVLFNLSLVIRSIEKWKDWWWNGWRAPAALHACQSWDGINPAAQLQAGGKCRLRAGVAVSGNCGRRFLPMVSEPFAYPPWPLLEFTETVGFTDSQLIFSGSHWDFAGE